MDEEIKLPEETSGEENKEKKSFLSRFRNWRDKNKKTDFYIELVLFFILGILIGIAVKTEAVKRITIGFDDYKMKIYKQDYDIVKIEKDLIEKQMQETQERESASAEENSVERAEGQTNEIESE